MNEHGIRIGLVIPLQGPAGIFGPSCEAVARTAVRTISRSGQLGESMSLQIIDGGASPQDVAATVARLIGQGWIDAVTGWHISAVREAVAPVTVGRIPYVYTSIYEGGEARAGVFCTGETPVQQVAPALRWLRDELDIRRWFIVGDDYVWPRRSVTRTREYIRELGLTLAGVSYVPLGTEDYAAPLDALAVSDAQAVLLYLVGQDAVHFNRAFAARNLDDRVVRLSPLMGENVLLASGHENTRALYSSAAYFRSLTTANALDLVRDYVDHHGADAPPLNNAAESCYEGLMTLVTLADRAGGFDLGSILQRAAGAGYDGPRGAMSLQGNHMHQPIHLARAADYDFDVVTTL